MKILVVGSGGREHAIVKKLSESPHVDEVLCAPGNGGIELDAKCYNLSATDTEGMIALARSAGAGLVFVAPDDPLALGMVDALEAAGIRAFGPNKAAARIEGSKAFAKNLMKKYGIPSAAYEVFDDADDAKGYIRAQGAPIVVKADGLALGKGVYVCSTVNDACAAVDEIMLDKKFGAAGERVIVEEFMTGPEVSVLCFTDSKTIVPMVSSQDHKRAYDSDKGPNTGGMGAFAPSPKYTPELQKKVYDDILVPTMQAMNAEGCPFRGILYVGLMLTKDGPKVLEYNARFGDPETQVVLPLLDSDFYEIIDAIMDERLAQVEIRWKPGFAAVVVMASGGYPVKYEKGYEIKGISEAERKGTIVYHAGTRLRDGTFVTSGGRVLGVTALGDTLQEAVVNAYGGVSCIEFKNKYFRTDIGKK